MGGVSPFRRLKVGATVGEDISIVGVVAEVRGRHPVYLAWSHPDWAPVVLKVFRTGEDARREHAVLERVSHPNVVRSLGLRPPRHLLMEHLDGPSLRHLLDESPEELKVNDVLRIGVHIGAALSRVHAAGYLHLDVKPGNVILNSGRPVLIDFGTARPIGYRAKKLMGTDGYIAPELGAGSALTPAADVFALAVTLIELIAGDLPHERPNAFTLDGEVIKTLYARVKPTTAAALLDAIAEDPARRPALETLLPALNAGIRRGPRMWPEGFDPAVSPARRA